MWTFACASAWFLALVPAAAGGEHHALDLTASPSRLATASVSLYVPAPLDGQRALSLDGRAGDPFVLALAHGHSYELIATGRLAPGEEVVWRLPPGWERATQPDVELVAAVFSGPFDPAATVNLFVAADPSSVVLKTTLSSGGFHPGFSEFGPDPGPDASTGTAWARGSGVVTTVTLHPSGDTTVVEAGPGGAYREKKVDLGSNTSYTLSVTRNGVPCGRSVTKPVGKSASISC